MILYWYRLLPGSRFELETRGFSIHCSTNWAIPALNVLYLKYNLLWPFWQDYIVSYMYINWFGSSKMIIIKNFSSNFILRRLANLQFAIGMLLLIGILIAIGTFIEQDQSIVFYQTNYPESQPIFGFVDWRFIYFLSLNKIYTSYWFAFILFVFASSLIACTFTTQLPLLKKI